MKRLLPPLPTACGLLRRRRMSFAPPIASHPPSHHQFTISILWQTEISRWLLDGRMYLRISAHQGPSRQAPDSPTQQKPTLPTRTLPDFPVSPRPSLAPTKSHGPPERSFPPRVRCSGGQREWLYVRWQIFPPSSEEVRPPMWAKNNCWAQ